MAQTVMTPIGVLNFPVFFEPKGNKQNPSQDPRFSGMLLFDDLGVKSTAYQELRKGVHAAIVDKFGEAKANDKSFVSGLRLPFRNASEKSYNGFEDGEIFISAWSKADQKPGVVNLAGEEIVVPADVFSGQLARFTVRPFAYDSNGNRGVSFGLEHVQIVKADMPRLDGRQSADRAFQNAPADDEQLKALGIDPDAAGSGSGSGGTNYGELPF